MRILFFLVLPVDSKVLIPSLLLLQKFSGNHVLWCPNNLLVIAVAHLYLLIAAVAQVFLVVIKLQDDIRVRLLKFIVERSLTDFFK